LERLVEQPTAAWRIKGYGPGRLRWATGLLEQLAREQGREQGQVNETVLVDGEKKSKSWTGSLIWP
jgi:hypothetical protein